MPRILDTRAAAPVPDEVVAAAAPVPDKEGLELLWLVVVAAACTQAPHGGDDHGQSPLEARRRQFKDQIAFFK